KAASLSAVQSLVSISIAMPCWYPQEWWTDDPTSPVGPGRSCNSRRGGSAQPDREPRDLVEPEPPVDRLAVGRGLEPGEAAVVAGGEAERRRGERRADAPPAVAGADRGAEDGRGVVEVHGDRSDDRRARRSLVARHEDGGLRIGEHRRGDQAPCRLDRHVEGFRLQLDDGIALGADRQLDRDSLGQWSELASGGADHRRTGDHHAKATGLEDGLDVGVRPLGEVEGGTPSRPFDAHLGGDDRGLRVVDRPVDERDLLGLVAHAAENDGDAAEAAYL